MNPFLKSERFIKFLKILFSCYFTFTIIVSLCMNLSKEIKFIESFSGNNMIYFGLAIMIYPTVYNSLFHKNDRKKVFSAIISAIIGLIAIIGFSLNNFNDLSNLSASFGTVIKNIIFYHAISTIAYIILLKAFDFISKYEIGEKNGKFEKLSRKKWFVICFLIIFIAWIPYFLAYYPGVLTTDSIDQISQIIGKSPLTNHHPLVHTFIIKICFSFTNNLEIGVATYSIVQMILMATIFAFVLSYLKKQNINKWIQIGALLYFAFFPVNAIYSVTMWKDILFSGILLVYCILIIDLVINKKDFKFQNFLVLLLISILVSTLRNNGYYVVFITNVFLLIFLAEYRKYIAILAVLTFAAYSIYKGPIFNYFGVTDGCIAEAMSVPLQQMARVYKYNLDILSDTDQLFIEQLLPGVDISNVYDPRLSDPIKGNQRKCKMDTDFFNSNKILFAKKWVGMFFKYPKDYIEAFLSNNFGYWYSDIEFWTASTTIKTNNLGLEPNSKLPKFKQLAHGLKIYNNRSLPVFATVISIGFNFIILLLSFAATLFKRNYKQLLLFVPIIILWLTVMAAPVYAENRYIYALFLVNPIIIGLVLNMKEKNSKAHHLK